MDKEIALENFIESIKRSYELKTEHLKEMVILEMFYEVDKLKDQVKNLNKNVNKLKKELKELKKNERN